jgi:translation initiation factor 1
MNNRSPGGDPTVYRSDSGRICPVCHHPIGQCTCKKMREIYSGDGMLKISLQTKGRGGKKVTVIAGFSLSGDELERLSGELKRKFGSGGSKKDNSLEIQGDFRQKARDELIAKGFKVKIIGG